MQTMYSYPTTCTSETHRMENGASGNRPREPPVEGVWELVPRTVFETLFSVPQCRIDNCPGA